MTYFYRQTHIKSDSFLEICRHVQVYKVIIDIVGQLSHRKQLLPLLGPLPEQSESVYDLLQRLDEQVRV